MLNYTREGSTFGPNTKIVQAGQSIQSVIDSCPVAIGSLKEGFTNPQVVRVPPGHEKEFYSLVRNAADVASDKRNVKVIFEDNPEGKFIIDQWDACDSLDSWEGEAGTVLSLDDIHSFTGGDCVKAVQSFQTASLTLTKTFTAKDLRGYQGILIDIDMDPLEAREFKLFMTDSAGNVNRTIMGTSTLTIDKVRTTAFFPLCYRYSDISLDFSQIVQLKILLYRAAGYTGVVTAYFDNIRLIRTGPYNAAILRFDDGFDEHFFQGVKHLENRGWRGLFAVSWIEKIMQSDPAQLTHNQIIAMADSGHDMVNHADIHRLFNTGVNKADTYYALLSCKKFLNFYGCAKTSGIIARPGKKTNSYLERLKSQIGGAGLGPFLDGFPAYIDEINSPAFAIPDKAQRFLDSKVGGIIQIVIHGIGNEANFVTMLDWVEENFSEVVLASDILEKLGKKYSITEDIPYGINKTLDADFVLYFWHGNEIFLDPGGAVRDIIPCDEFPSSHRLELINTADAAETLTFDPTFTAAGNHSGANDADTLTATDTWVVGQLVGRTLGNTPDGSSGVITANGEHTVTAVLSGGTSNDWQTGEAYTITPAGLNQAVAQNERATFVYDGEGWDITNLYTKV